MKERPIIFSALMVRAILEGRKTQTRRVMKPQPEVSKKGNLHGAWLGRPLGGLLLPKIGDIVMHCPYGQPCDRLWVRETFKHAATEWNGAEPDVHRHRISYMADGDEIAHSRPSGDWSGLPNFKDESYWDRRSIPSIHMPRWASRILLEITAVRVERLQDISVADAMAEGVIEVAPHLRGLGPCMEWRYAYEDLWRSINGAGSWDENPWVWCISFRRIDAC